MLKYMLVGVIDGESFARFYDELDYCEDARMDVCCGCGGYAEIYERVETENGREYVLLYA